MASSAPPSERIEIRQKAYEFEFGVICVPFASFTHISSSCFTEMTDEWYYEVLRYTGPRPPDQYFSDVYTMFIDARRRGVRMHYWV